MITIRNTINQISAIYANSGFDLVRWRQYIQQQLGVNSEWLFLDDMNQCLTTGTVTFTIYRTEG